MKIVGRSKDMIIRGGENVYPREIEEFLYTHPDVADVQVVGVPDERYGEEVMAFGDPAARAPSVDRGRAARVLPRQDRPLQGAALRRVRRRVPDDRHRQGPEVQDARRRRSRSSGWRRLSLPEPAYYDEAYEGSGEPRPHYRAALDALGVADLDELAEELRAEVRERGVRYGSTGPGEFVVDAVPRLFTREEWEGLERGLAQRMRALDAFLRDAYGERADRRGRPRPGAADRGRGVLRARHAGPRGARVGGLRGARRGARARRDVPGARGQPADADRRRVRAARAGARRRGDRPGAAGAPPGPARAGARALRGVLRGVAPGGDGDPSMVVLGDGFENDAQWEISEVAYRMGLPMVTLDDLSEHDGRSYARVEGRRRPVDVVYRRSNYHLLREGGKPSALAGAARADAPWHRDRGQPARGGDRRRQARPRLRPGDDPLLPRRGAGLASATSYDLTDDEVREDVLGRLGELVVKARDRVGGEGVLIGEEAESAAGDIRETPDDYIAQELVELSRHPT